MRKIIVGGIAVTWGCALLFGHLLATGSLFGIALGAVLLLGGGQSIVRGRRERVALRPESVAPPSR